MTPSPVLSVQDLSISFGGLKAVDGVTFEVARNRITTVIGPNGAGKSTLFNLISGALKPHRGRVTLDGRDVTRLAPDRMQTAGLARSFQITNLFSELTVAENLRLAAQALEPSLCALLPVATSRTAAHRVEEMLQRFSLSSKAAHRVDQLSHGEQRRLEVAVALTGQPKVLLLDEPTQGMSQGDTEDTARLIRSLLSDVTVLLIEHDIALVMSLSDHVVVMHQGQKLAEGAPGAVRANPAVQAAYLGQG